MICAGAISVGVVKFASRTVAGYCAGLLLATSALVWPATAAAEAYVTQSDRVACLVAPDPELRGYGDAVGCQGRFYASTHRRRSAA